MKNIDDFLDAAKKVTNSDYRTAKEIGIAPQHLGNWRGRRSFPNNTHIMAICDLANVDLRLAIEAVEYSRENEKPIKQAGFADVLLLATISAGSIGAMSLGAVTPLSYASIGAVLLSGGYLSIHYTKSNIVIVKSDGTMVCIDIAQLEAHLPCWAIEQLLKSEAANDAECAEVPAHSFDQFLINP